MKDILTVIEHQEIYVSKTRNLEKYTISYEDRELLFDIVHLDRDNKNRYVVSNKGGNRLKVNSIVGSISLKTGLTIEILPKFAKNNLDEDSIKKHRKMLINILRVSNEKNFISSSSQNSKVLADEMPLLHYVIELFSEELLNLLRGGVYTNYNKKIENSSHVRGTILVSKTIQNNIIDKSKVYISYNQHSSNNLLMQLFRTLAKILLNDKNLSYKAKQNLHEIYLLLDNIEIIKIQKYDFKKITFNRLNDKFETLFTQAEFIFNQYMPFSSSINSTPFWSILFDMNYLFENFCAYLFRKSKIKIKEQSITNCFTDTNKIVSAKPDFIIQNNTETINVVDAKWKMLDKEKSLYGLNAQNFWQLFSYMNLINQDKEIKGYFIVPKYGDSFEDEIIFTPIKDGNKSINILSIDFSLDFEVLVNKYSFEMIDNELKVCKKIVKQCEDIKIEVDEVVEIEIKEKIATIKETKDDVQFDLEEFIRELETLNSNKNLRKKLSPSKYDEKFSNLFYLKEKYETKSQTFKIVVKENIVRKEWSFTDLELTTIPKNIMKLKGVTQLSFENNNIKTLPKELFKLNKLKSLNFVNNNIVIIPSEIKELKNLLIISIYENKNIDVSNILEVKSLIRINVDKDIIFNNIKIMKELKTKDIEILDSSGNDLIEYINSFSQSKESAIINTEGIESIIDEKDVLEDFIELNIKNYNSISEDDKIDFCIVSELNTCDDELLKKLCYEESEDILVELLEDKKIKIRFVLLIYILNSNNQKFIKEYIINKIDTFNHKQLSNIIFLAEEKSFFDVSKYIEENFKTIDDEILFGYAIIKDIINSTISKTREMISKLTNNLELLDELSKNKYDSNVIGNIIFKSMNNPIFTENVKNKDTKYTLITLDRIARYEQYYRYEDEFCKISQIANNFNLSDETREYLFNKYKNDKVLLKKLHNYHCSLELQKEIEAVLNEEIYNDFSNDKDEVFNGIAF